MRGQRSYWTAFEPDAYLDLRQPEWIAEEAARWIRYVVSDQGAFIHVHGLEARRVVEQLGMLNSARPAQHGL